MAEQSIPVEFAGRWIPDGFQVKKVRRPRKDAPAWIANEGTFRKVTIGRGLRRYTIAHLYWRCGWNAREVSEELRLPISTVERTIERLKYHK